ncbi:alpha/beta hydrolase [Paenibacillus sp. HGF5]|uniref:alpha/beta hydrolase n=1 Tax=Paenibacillus sp. HGF5 TaxID=908341 RepID=UPI00020724ED|nr:alpha/beta hydrolase-fold protein [Paenibacillus sp. HGF5]EGG33615.1 putative esterase [Paenibacillus sp. HGF5]
MNRYKQLVVEGRELTLYLPPSYLESDRSYPVAYVQDEGDMFMDCLNYLNHLFAAGRLEEIILVGISTTNRNREYTPWPAEPLLASNPPFGGEGRAYVDEVADVIKAYIDHQYRTLPAPEHTAIIGGSFGGLISMFAGYWRPDTFGRIGMLSASLWYEGVMDYIRQQGMWPDEQRVYMSVGQLEGAYKQNAQKNMFVNNVEAHRFWLEQGVSPERLQLAVDPDGTHDPIFMSRRFPDALRWLFVGEAEEQVSAKGRAQHEDPDIQEKHELYNDQDKQDKQDNQVKAPLFSVPGTLTWSMQSDETGREYRIFIAEPMGPPPEGGYPVLYSLDANATFGTLAEAIRLQSRTPRGIPSALIVGIGFDSDSPIVSSERFYNFTEYADPAELPVRPNGMDWPETGGVEAFLTFIEQQLKPAVERRYAVNRSKQALFGHSLGGFFTLYTLFTRPEAFSRYIAACPSVWWKNYALYKRWEEGEARLRQSGERKSLRLYVGAEEKPSMVKDARELYAFLKGHEEVLETTFDEIEGEGHVSVLPTLISPLLRFVNA